MSNFIRIPVKLLNTDLSPRAILLYGLIQSRIDMSQKNGWQDSNGTYCYYTQTAIMEDLSVTERQARRLLRELEANGLITRQSRSGAVPDKLYLTLTGQKCPAQPDKNVRLSRTKMSAEIYNINKKVNTCSYPATYDIADYESHSVVDYDDEEDEDE